jgi:UDP-glucose 4-epimerase
LNKLLKNPQKLEILGTGLETRDFIYVQDAISALLLASTDLTSKSRVFNIGTGISTSIKEMIALILKTSNLSPELVFTQASWKGDIKQLTSNSDKLRALGFKPMYSLESGVRETVNWFDQTFKQ